MVENHFPVIGRLSMSAERTSLILRKEEAGGIDPPASILKRSDLNCQIIIRSWFHLPVVEAVHHYSNNFRESITY